MGWLFAECIFGRAASTVETLGVGILVGMGIAGVLGAAEGVVLRSWTLARHGALIGVVAGALGGVVGAAFGQLGYLSASSSSQDGDGGDSPGSGRSFFSPHMRERFERADAHEGDIEIGLSWENRNDLDLHVLDPNGELIYYKNPLAASLGELDVDKNVKLNEATNEPVEHVYWPENGAPLGNYVIYVDYFNRHQGQPNETAFHVEMVVDGKFREFEGTIRHGDRKQRVHSFERKPVAEQSGGLGFLEWLAVIFGWTVFGALVGIAEGLRRRSGETVRNAALGGTIGGALGGLTLVALCTLLPAGAAGVGRMAGFVVLGACIGLWIVIVARALAAVLSVRNGPQKGHEILLDKPVMRVGRDEMLEVYLGGDAKIEGHHATIRREGNGHAIEAVDGSITVNGSPATGQALHDGDKILIGETRFVYNYKATSPERDAEEQETRRETPRSTAAPPPPPPPPPPPVPPS